jgi:hypothetical protein
MHLLRHFLALFRARFTVAINESALTGAIAAFNEVFQVGAAGAQGDWVRISPFGEFPNEVGLQVFDRAAADAIVSAFNTAATKAATLWRGLPIYEGHPDEPAWQKANPGYKRIALGRVKELQTRADGLYGRVAFNDRGNPMVRGEAPAYEAQSPRWGMAKIAHQGRTAFRPMELYSLGLTNQPNIPGTHLGLNEREGGQNFPVMKKHIIALLAALGRPVANADTVSDDQLAAAVNEAVPVATAAITAQNELASVKPQLTTAQNEVTTLRGQLATANGLVTTERTAAANERKARVELVLTSAVNEGRITQAQRAEWEGKFNAQGADFGTVQGELQKLKKAVNTRPAVAGLGARKPEELAATNRIAAINEAVEAKKKANPTLSHTDAFNAVRCEKPDLFVTAAA